MKKLVSTIAVIALTASAGLAGGPTVVADDVVTVPVETKSGLFGSGLSNAAVIGIGVTAVALAAAIASNNDDNDATVDTD